jgi:hypothetical protein
MKRREFVEKFGIGSAALASGSVAAGALLTAGPASPAPPDQDAHDHRAIPQISGALSTAIVSFGQWMPPVDRFVSPNAGNGHVLIPNVATVRAGGTVNFIIAGLHQVIVYEPRKTPDDVNAAMVRNPPTTPPLIDDPVGRIYAGPDPTIPGTPRDRVEAVLFANRGVHLVICGVQGHFVNDRMFGYVVVV